MQGCTASSHHEFCGMMLHFIFPEFARLPTQLSSVECPTVLGGDKRPYMETQVELLNSTQRSWVVDSLPIPDYFQLAHLDLQETLQTCMSLKWTGTHRNQPVAHTRSERVHCHWCEACPSRPDHSSQCSTGSPSLGIGNFGMLEIAGDCLRLSDSPLMPGISWTLRESPGLKQWNHVIRRTLWANTMYTTLRNSGPTAYALPLLPMHLWIPDVVNMIRINFGSFSLNFAPSMVHVYLMDGNIGSHEAISAAIIALGNVANRHACATGQTNGLPRIPKNCIPASQKMPLKTKQTVIILKPLVTLPLISATCLIFQQERFEDFV